MPVSNLIFRSHGPLLLRALRGAFLGACSPAPAPRDRDNKGALGLDSSPAPAGTMVPAGAGEESKPSAPLLSRSRGAGAGEHAPRKAPRKARSNNGPWLRNIKLLTGTVLRTGLLLYLFDYCGQHHAGVKHEPVVVSAPSPLPHSDHALCDHYLGGGIWRDRNASRD